MRPAPRPPRRTALVAAVGMLLAGVASAAPLDARLRAALDRAGPDGEVAIVVTLAAPPAAASALRGRGGRTTLVRTLQEKTAAGRSALEPFLLRAGVDATTTKTLWIVNGLALRARPDAVRELAGRPDVAAVRLDASWRLPDRSAGSASPDGWNLAAVKAPQLWALGHTGAGVVVASLDSGVDAAQRSLEARWRGGPGGWFDPHGEHETPYDSDGHGTQTVGLMVGGDAGVAPGASWIAAKIFDDRGFTTLSAIHLAFQWVLDPDGDPDTDDAPDVVANSWGFEALVDRCDTEFGADIAVLKAAGIAVVFAAGNAGPAAHTSVSPANNPGALSVGAVDELGTVLTFSSRGPSACGGLYPHVVAPGVNLRTADLTLGGVMPDAWAYVTGTSFAAPQVAGGLALLRGAFPAATVEELEAAVQEGAADIAEAGPDDDSGRGLLDLAGAYAVLVSRFGPPSCDGCALPLRPAPRRVISRMPEEAPAHAASAWPAAPGRPAAKGDESHDRVPNP